MLKKKFDVVLLSGGGIKGIGHLGTLHYYYEQGMLNLSYVKEFVGTSIGALINFLMVCGYTPMEIFTKVYTLTDFFKLESANIWDLFSKYGLLSIHPLMRPVEEMVMAKFGKLPTLLELKELTGKVLTITSVNVSKTRVVYLNYETHPKLGALDAVKMSCNLPLIFQRIEYGGDFWVDGGLVDSFPYGAIKNINDNILGIVVTGNDRTDAKDSFFNYLYQLAIIPMNTMTQLRTKNMGKNVKLITMVFDGVAILNFAMESHKKMSMFMKGYNIARRDEEKEMLSVKEWTFYEEKIEEVEAVEVKRDDEVTEITGITEWNTIDGGKVESANGWEDDATF